MGTGKQRTSLAVRARVEPVIDPAPAELVDRVGLVELAELDVRVAQVELEALAGLAVPAAQAELAVRVAPVGLAVPAEPAVQAGQVELVVQVAPVELGIAPEVPAQETGPAEVVPEPVLVALPRRIRSATAPHHHGQVPVQRVEDSAVAAETTPEPAATEAEKAWAAAE
jgi:hypothetical protein